ncbi:Syntaxin-5 [Branchiostoma belcheri]|nr:Syntaxin-5 [Branchiostoma belcheri]
MPELRAFDARLAPTALKVPSSSGKNPPIQNPGYGHDQAARFCMNNYERGASVTEMKRNLQIRYRYRSGPGPDPLDLEEPNRRIGRDIANTFAKLEKLTILAKRKSLFDDKPVEIQELTYIIKQDIASLNKQIAELQEFARSRVRQNGRHVQSHSNSVVVALQSKLATMSNDFKSVLEVRTENLKHQRSRREQFSQGPVSSSMPPSTYNAPNGEAGGSILLLDETKSLQSGEVAIDMDALERQRHQRQLQLVEEDDAYIQERARTMENIESTIVELGSIFQQLATMVKEQEEQVQRIDDNVEDTVLNVEAAHGEILKYFQSISSNRWLMIKVFGVLIVFFIIFVVFLA